ncbi:uncharacterized protein LOC124448069 isoform X2 [Xenia sp. Carnegie-2017]|uniref:uncharacterized protein LOC124448069 isoform X2 n=1 Tax=Xenia sp. Carnegie-2017 TaxID=2897299 RepID=UPI001F03EF88|nr:uncharacterized protein LOC124448069 isoform X2 [Xenia sp. Carnegie-2017]
MKNLYEQLGLDMREVRKMDEDQRKKAIQKGFLKMILIWHPDKPNGDKEIADQLVQARNILQNDEMRAQYHNQIDFNQGWFSIRRWKTIFAPEMATEEQWKAFLKRLAFLGLSSLLAVGGIAATVCTAGLAAPVFVILGAIAGGALTGAGLQSLGETVSKKSVVHGIDVKNWAKKALIGSVAGAIAGGASGGITAAMVGIGSAALPSAAVSIGQYVSMGAANGAIGGAMFSLSSDLAKKIVDEKDISLKQFLLHTLCGALIGATAGIAGGAVTEALVDSGSVAAEPTLEGDAVEQFSAQAPGKNVYDVVRGVAKKATIEGTKSTANVPYKFADERLDSSVENRRLTTHLEEGAQNIFLNTVKTSIIQAVGATQGYSLLNQMKEVFKLVPGDLGDMLQSVINDNSGNISNGIDVYPDCGQESVDCPDGSYVSKDRYNEDENVQSREADTRVFRATVYGQTYASQQRCMQSEANNVYCASVHEQTYASQPLHMQSESSNVYFASVHEQTYASQPLHMQSEANNVSWASVHGQTYNAPQETANTFDTHEVGFNVNSSAYRESAITNPEAEDCFVQIAGDVLSQRDSDGLVDVQHIEKLASLKQVLSKTIIYKSNGAWFSKMIVSYSLNGKKYRIEECGDRKRVEISENATDIKVKLQVSRPVWGDVMKYDRFKKKWSTPSEPHIFRYKKAVDRTFTISGILWFEAVMAVTDEYHEETKEMGEETVISVPRQVRRRTIETDADNTSKMAVNLQNLINDNSGNISNGIDVYPDCGQESVDSPDGPYVSEDRYNEDENVQSSEAETRVFRATVYGKTYNAPQPLHMQSEANTEYCEASVHKETCHASQQSQQTANATSATNEVGFNEAEDCSGQIVRDFLFQINPDNPFDIQHIENSASSKQVLTKTITYIYNGAWISKMIVSYSLNEVRETKAVSGDRKRVEISANATDT